jgi:hypothetical protein
MDESRLKKIVSKILDTSFEGFTIREFRVLPTQKMDEDGNWVPWSHTLFIGLNRPANFYLQEEGEWDVSQRLEQVLGFEVIADFF